MYYSGMVPVDKGIKEIIEGISIGITSIMPHENADMNRIGSPADLNLVGRRKYIGVRIFLITRVE